jgi:hypothetical protein
MSAPHLCAESTNTLPRWQTRHPGCGFTLEVKAPALHNQQLGESHCRKNESAGPTHVKVSAAMYRTMKVSSKVPHTVSNERSAFEIAAPDKAR